MVLAEMQTHVQPLVVRVIGRRAQAAGRHCLEGGGAG